MFTRIWPVLCCAISVAACQRPDTATTTIPFHDNFERSNIGDDYLYTGGHWTIKDGQLYSTGANNAPLFLKADLPDDVVVEVDVKSATRNVDAKVELMTNGRAHQSGYVFVLGGWDNKVSIIARLDEHGRDRQEKKPTLVVGNASYHWRIEKKGGQLRWLIDHKPYLNFNDSAPLQGPEHNRFAFSNWQNQLYFDNLHVWPLAEAPPLGTTSTTTP